MPIFNDFDRRAEGSDPLQLPNQKWLENMTVSEMEQLEKEGHSRRAPLGPKVRAALRFVRNGGDRAVIASLEEAIEALEGKAGTQIHKS